MILNRIHEKFCPLLYLESGHLPVFVERMAIIEWNYLEKRFNFSEIYDHLPTFCPLLKAKVATEKSLTYGLFEGSCPLSRFLFYLIVNKKIYKYI
ncbi:MAG: hypothetical protein Q4G33_14385 [bacterium]|nr:hypothetical protein [bacterium]